MMRHLEYTLNESLLQNPNVNENNKKNKSLLINNQTQDSPKIEIKVSVKSLKIQKEPKINLGLRHILDTLSHCITDITICSVYLIYLLSQNQWQGLSAFRNFILGVLNVKSLAEVLIY